MLRRRWSFRLFASLLALWLPLVAGEAGLMQPCPVHGVHAVGAGMHAGAGMAGAHHASHGAMSHHHDGAGDHGSTPSHEHHDCSCIACCTMSVAATVGEGAPTIEVPEGIASPLARFPVRSLLVVGAAEYSRPYTTGPPRA